MSTTGFIIFAGDSAWSIGVQTGEQTEKLEAGAGLQPAALAAAIAQSLRERGYNGAGIVLAVPSAWCLCASISLEGLPRRERHEAMLYRLEDRLPLAAEDVVADFVEHGESALGVCLRADRLLSLVRELELAGVTVAAICPAAMLAAQQFAQREGAELDAILLASGEELDVIMLDQRRPAAWVAPAAGSGTLLTAQLRAQIKRRGRRLRVLTAGIDSAGLQRLGELEIDWERTDVTPAAACMAIAGRLVAGGAQPWVNLRRDQLGVADRHRAVRGPLNIAIAAAMLLCASLIAILLWRAERYSSLASTGTREQQMVFREIFPQQSAPVGVKSRLLSEVRRLRGLSGESTDLPQRPSALDELGDFLARLPADLRYQMWEIRLDDGTLFVEGQTRTHGDAESIAAALRKNNGFAMGSPRTEQQGERGVSFSFSGTAPASTEKEQRR